MSIPLFRPPSVEEASRNAEGNKSDAMPVLEEIKQTSRHVQKGIAGLLRSPVSLALDVTAKTIDATSNIVGIPVITGYRVAKYVRDTRDSLRKVTDLEFGSGAHHAHAA